MLSANGTSSAQPAGLNYPLRICRPEQQEHWSAMIDSHFFAEQMIALGQGHRHRPGPGGRQRHRRRHGGGRAAARDAWQGHLPRHCGRDGHARPVRAGGESDHGHRRLDARRWPASALGLLEILARAAPGDDAAARGTRERRHGHRGGSAGRIAGSRAENQCARRSSRSSSPTCPCRSTMSWPSPARPESTTWVMAIGLAAFGRTHGRGGDPESHRF